MPYFGNNPSPLLLNTVAQNGKEMTLDADADTSITADTDDQIDIKIGGSDIFQLTASKLDINGKELVLDADADTSITADTDDQIDIRIGGADDFQFTANTFTVKSGSTIVVDDTTDSTSTTTGSIQTDGGVGIAKDLVVGDDLFLKSDSAVINFGADNDVTLTHVADSGLKLNDDRILYLGDDQDFQFTHLNSSNLQIIDANARLLIRSPRIDFQNGDGTETTGVSIADGVFSLFHDNTEKFTTASTGVTITGTVLSDRGTASAPGYSFSDDPDTGMFNVSNADLAFSVGGTERMRINSNGYMNNSYQPVLSLYGDTVRVAASGQNTDTDVSFLENFDNTNNYDTANKYFNVPQDGRYLINFFASVKSDSSYVMIKIKVGTTTEAVSYGEEPNLSLIHI